jgi:hypothetical protein
MSLEDLFSLEWEESVSRVRRALGWALEEIEAARVRHNQPDPETSTIKARGLRAVKQASLLGSETLFRLHCREILDRIAAGADLGPGTDAEMIRILRDYPKDLPMPPGAATLYFRLVARRFPEIFAEGGVDLASYESEHGSTADAYETRLREKLIRDRERIF